jgi:hypothetical protein
VRMAWRARKASATPMRIGTTSPGLHPARVDGLGREFEWLVPGRRQPALDEGLALGVSLPAGDRVALAGELTQLRWRPRVVLISSDRDPASRASSINHAPPSSPRRMN